jgi:hypothetical protein
VVYVPSAELYDLSRDLAIVDRESERSFLDRWRAVTLPDPYYGANMTVDPPTFDFESRANER